jgi:hypothetical protein
VFADLGGLAPGRYGYLLLKFLGLAGYRVVLRHDARRFTAGDYGELVFRIPGLRIALAPPRDAASFIYLGDRAEPRPGGRYAGLPWRAAVRVDVDVFSEDARRPGALHVPFPMHPLVYHLRLDAEIPRLREARRVMRILFAGNQDAEAYGPASVARFGVVPRHELLEHVRATLRPGELAEAADAGGLPSAGDAYSPVLVLVDTGRVWIPREAWLGTLARSDFFLAPPGVAMPLCHNLVEAMAVGTVPITEYGGLLPVPLEHRRNCIAFRGRAELPGMLREVLAMHRCDVERMRREAIRYYEEHLAPASFGRRLAAVPAGGVTAYMAAEHASVRAMDAATRGGAGSGDPGWHGGPGAERPGASEPTTGPQQVSGRPCGSPPPGAAGSRTGLPRSRSRPP